jgi:uncharacterized protein YkvS
MIAMKIKRVILYFVISVCSVAKLPALTIPDSILTLPEFRNVKWGASLRDVEEKETAHYLQVFTGFGIEAHSYEGNIAGLDTRIDYTFKDRKFSEGSYTIISNDTFREDFLTLLRFLQDRYGKAGYSSGPFYTSDSVWIKINDYGMFVGPSLYWVFKDGFIGLISEKFEEEVTLTILFASNLTVEEYNSKNLVELKNYRIIRLNNEKEN